MAKGTKARNIGITLAVIAFLGIMGWAVYSFSVAQTAYNYGTGNMSQTPTSLIGKAATVSVFGYDQAAASPQSSKIAGLLYLIENPVTSADGKTISGTFAADGTTLSTTARTDVTEGLNVGDTFIGVIANGTYYGKPSSAYEIKAQSGNLDLDAYKTATSGGKIVLKDTDETVITASAVGTNNLTLAATQDEKFYLFRIENNNSARAWNVEGFYIDKAVGSNLSAFSGSGTTTGSYAVGYSKGGEGLLRTDADDEIFYFSSPIMLLEYDSIDLSDLKVKADGDGCAVGDTFAIGVFDANWFRSAKTNSLKLGAETDADSPADVGVSDYSVTYACQAP